MTYEHTNDCADYPQLHISEAGCRDRTVAIRGTTTIGRDNDNDIVLKSMTVSRQHAMLLSDAAGLLLLDLDSTNGTLVNSVLAQSDAPVRLADGDELRLGQVLARYVAESSDHGGYCQLNRSTRILGSRPQALVNDQGYPRKI